MTIQEIEEFQAEIEKCIFTGPVRMAALRSDLPHQQMLEIIHVSATLLQALATLEIAAQLSILTDHTATLAACVRESGEDLPGLRVYQT